MMFHVEQDGSLDYDVIVIGGGHAGCEAAAAAARKGVRVVLVTEHVANLGMMSCNPAIGGVGKGHLVREIDVFDGLIARAADASAIHYRMLNSSKGAAVRGPRIQADRRLFQQAIASAIHCNTHIDVIASHVDRLVMNGDRVSGVMLKDGRMISALAVVLATGTFLSGRLHRGRESVEGGRVGEPSANALAFQLREVAKGVGRLKTGTPPRIDGRTINWALLAEQPSDIQAWKMSPRSGARRRLPQVACAVARTNEATHEIIRHAMDRSPLFSGAIEGRGPRYCPSIEDKIVRFGDRDGHQIFLEPEGLDTRLVYPNGISTSLPPDVQEAFVKSIVGLEDAVISQPGYAVEYDFLDPRGLTAALMSKNIIGLYCAGQINGTTGYEEAAAQGLVAGLNAAAFAWNEPPILFDRTQSYIGVLVDDLTLQGVTEPYRMLTSRAEYRLHLRADNAIARLGEFALASGAVGADQACHIKAHNDAIASSIDLLQSSFEGRSVINGVQSGEGTALGSITELISENCPPALVEEIYETIRYAPYVERQQREVERVRREGAISLGSINARYAQVPGLSQEMVERLELAQPPDLAAAGRIRGITPAALSAILLAARKVA